MCHVLDDQECYDSIEASVGEVTTSLIIFLLYLRFVRNIYLLIDEIDLDMVRRSKNVCQSVGAVGLLFITACC